jgi:hypothetical protein
MDKIFKKVDRRTPGHENWKYYIPRPKTHYMPTYTLYESKQTFFEWRKWCTETWGHSKEFNDWLEDLAQSPEQRSCFNEHWCYQNNEYHCRIFLRTDKDLSIFLLKWAS